MEEKERKQLKKRLLGLVINEPPYPYPITMAEVMVNDMSKPNLKPLLNFIEQELDKAREEGKKVTGETSDGYHTFNELYEHRHLLFSKLAEWKSKKHSDGTMFDDWFIAGIGKDKGEQITYHIPLRLWDSFNCEELDTAPEWDGHTANDVLKRLTKLTTK